MKVLLEALVVGLVTSIVGLIIATTLMFTQKDFSLKTYTFWPRVMIGYFLTGFLLHLLFEGLGANKWYCKNGNACL